MNLIIGLGNPGPYYAATRHNAGFMAIDQIANEYGVSFSANKKFQGEVAELNINNDKVFLFKPSSFMNLSGECVSKIKNYYKIDGQNIIVIYDDIDLALGKFKIKLAGSSGGHNGIKSIDAHIGSNYWRLRLGIGRPLEARDVADYVLSNFSKGEMTSLSISLIKIATNLNMLQAKNFDTFLRNIM